MANWVRLFCLYIIEQQLFHSKKVFKSFVLYRPIAPFKHYISFTLDCTLQSLLWLHYPSFTSVSFFGESFQIFFLGGGVNERLELLSITFF
jgi:hypothetical protein